MNGNGFSWMRPSDRTIKYIGYAVSVVLIAFAILFCAVFMYTQIIVYQAEHEASQTAESPTPFPVGVDPVAQKIDELTDVQPYFKEFIAASGQTRVNQLSNSSNWFAHTFALLTKFSWYQGLASPTSRILAIWPGDRKEEIAHTFAGILGWSKSDEQVFLDAVASSTPGISDGFLYPATYVVTKDATPNDVASKVSSKFKEEVLARYTGDVSSKVPLEQALTVASLLERESSNFDDMRSISGVIWNRLFAGMKLQIDATLQYAKGTKSASTWWPPVRPDDKYITSPYNTYQNEGLPPGPIAEPSLAAILAALNPHSTECMFYFHDKNNQFHCTKTYEEHVAELKKYYGRGL